MTGVSQPSFVKRYSTPSAASAAAAHYRWLRLIAAPQTLPDLYRQKHDTLAFEHIVGRTASSDDLPTVATVLGHLHRLARENDLRTATTNAPLTTSTGLRISGFAGRRRDRLHARLDLHRSVLTHATIDHWLDAADDLPVALYKDMNPRNVIIRPTRGIVFIDFDDLTLAPCGYDLAKLVVTTTMSSGPIPPTIVETAIDAYAVALAHPQWTSAIGHVQVWAEFHHVLSRPWIGHHYHHDWNTDRPWSAPDLDDEVPT